MLRPAPTIDIGLERRQRTRSRLVRLGVLALAVVATAAIVHGDGPAFPYRLGQRAERQIRVKEPFARANPIKTLTARDAASRRVSPILDNDAGPIQELRKELLDLVAAVAAAPRSTLEALPADVTNAWKLDVATFEELRAASDTPERREELTRRVDEAFAPLERHGVLGPGVLPADLDPQVPLEIRSVGKSESLNVPRDLVLRERLLRPDGPAAEQFMRVFRTPTLGRAMFGLVSERLANMPTLRYDEDATREAQRKAASGVPGQVDTYERGDVLVEQGQILNEDQLQLLSLEHSVANSRMSISARARRVGAILVLVAAVFALLAYYVIRSEPTILERLPGVAAVCGVVAGSVGLARVTAGMGWDAEVIPVALAGMTLAVAYNSYLALMATFCISLLTSLAVGTGLGHFLVLVGGTSTAVLLLGEVRTRMKPIQVGAAAGFVFFLLTWAVGLWQNQPIELVWSDSLWRGAWGLMSGFFLGGCLPFVENAFGIVTGISLLELGDATHPVLQELVRRAPGTHNHSIAVGVIAEAAAKSIGADALLVRIGAYFHDIGKMLKPHYFIENQLAGTANRHENLAPAMSTLIIIGHVKDGAELARQHHLPERIIDLIEQHHGTTLVEYFYREATRRTDGDPDAPRVLESSFRYPGPKPQTKEAAILMVADAVESASRTLSDPTPSRLEGLVEQLVDKRLRDGQFDECPITMRELATVRDSLVKSLIGIYHGRIKYHEQRTSA